MTRSGPRRGAAARLFVLLCTVAACGGDPPVGPSAAKPQTFELYLVDNQSLPMLAYTTGFGGKVYIRSARLVSVEPGRVADPRIFEDRSGNGSGGGSSRDSVAGSARMADVRVFEDRNAANAVVGTHTDSSGVIVERRGDIILVKREHPDPTRTVVDTGFFENGIVRLRVREWERFGTASNATFQYVVGTTTPQ